MQADLPHLTPEAFRTRLEPSLPGGQALPPNSWVALHAHYDELRNWAPRLALIGPGTLPEVLDRHFGEALAALAHIPPTPPASGNLLDLGSGAGFPGLVLAAARPAWTVTLVEARQKKWAFLMAVARKAGLSCRCLNARVGSPLPDGVPADLDLLTARAIRLPASDLGLLLERLTAPGRGLFWAGDAAPELPSGYESRALQLLAGSDRRWILEVTRVPPAAGQL